jgi:hypothetical protein
MGNKTAVEWLQSIELERDLTLADWKQAKEIEKKQMDKVAEDWWNEGARSVHDGKKKYESFEQYYDEIYGNNHIGEVNKMVGGEQ